MPGSSETLNERYSLTMYVLGPQLLQTLYWAQEQGRGDPCPPVADSLVQEADVIENNWERTYGDRRG